MRSAIIDDLQAEQEALEAVLVGLDEHDWATPSAAEGWSVADVVLHLAQTEEAVVHALRNDGTRLAEYWRHLTSSVDGTVDGAMAALVQAERGPGQAAVLDRWATARREALHALRRAEPRRAAPWVATPLKPRTLATTRLAEHWAHALDVTVALGIAYPETERLRHIAWLGYATLPYAFELAGHRRYDIYCELTAPDGSLWRFGPSFAASSVTGPASEFCRVGTRRLAPEASELVASGPYGRLALQVLRTYAG
jgi:uncharacterized protein (TIGR03084 family)